MAKQVVNDRDIKSLTTIEHILLRPNTYLGSVKESTYKEWVLDENDNLSYKDLIYVEGAKKCLTEIIDNSVDEYIKTKGEYSTKISITMTNDTFICEDNGRGIPVKKTEDGEWMPMVALCRPMSGSNFTDDNRTTVGTNGLGSKIASVFSKSFDAVTCDGKGKLKVTSKNNLSEIKVTELTPTPRTGTKITYVPDFDRFGIKDFGDAIPAMIKTRLKFLSWFCPKCTFTFNDEKITFKIKDFTSLFPSPSVVLNNDNAFVCVYPTDEPYVLSYVNTMSLRRGGTHVDYIMNKLVNDIREKVSKKYKNIKPADIRNRLGIVVFLKSFPNCEFDSQTKEAITNSQSDITAFINDNNVDLDALSNKVLKEKEILDNITDIFKAKEEIAEAKELAKKTKIKRDFESEKYYAPVGKTEKKYLMIVEGFSAFSGISPILGRKGIGYYMLRGKPENILDEKASVFMANQEIRDIVQILGIDISDPETDMNYDKVVILSDADADGTAIAGLVITIFSKLAPRMLREGRICRMETPLLIGLDNKDNVKEYYFNFPEKSSMKKDLKYFYLKGLGSWTKSRLNQIIDTEGGMDNLIKPYLIDNTTTQTIQNWFGKDSEPRKNALRGREFHIDNA